MENKVPKIILKSGYSRSRPWVWLTIFGVLLLFMNQNVQAQTECTNPINYALVGVDATSATANNAKLRISGVLSGNNKIGYSVGSTYTGPNFGSATLYSVFLADSSYISRTLPTPTNTTGTVYTIRVFSEDGSCYTDKTFTLEYVNFNSTPVNPDIKVTMGVSPSGFVALNSTVSVTVTVTNEGTGPATGVVYTIGIPPGLTGVTGTTATGTYSGTTWTIGNLPAGGQPVTLTLTGTVGTRGVKYVAANLTAENEQDFDSSPTTDNAGEDDQGTICISTPFDFCANDEYTVTLPNYRGIKWFKGGTEIIFDAQGNAPGVKRKADSSLVIFSEGEYSYTKLVGLGACLSGECCPIKVEAGKPPVLVAPADQSICFNASFATITAQNTQTTPNGTFIYEWYNDNGTANPTSGIISGQNTLTFTALPTAVGVYKYKLKAYEQGHKNCADSLTITLEIKDLPVPTIASNSPVCEEGTISLTADGAGSGGSYAWTGPASFTANTATPTRVSAVEAFEGTYVVTLTNGVACSATASVAVVINTLPPPPFAENKVFCAEDSAAILVARALPDHTLLWYDTNSTGGRSSGTAPTHDPVSPVETYYYVSQKDANGCESHRDDLLVKVNEKPAAPVVVTSPISACQDSAPITLTADTGSSGFTLLWYGTASTAGTSSNTATIAPTNTVGTTTYYVSKKNDVTTCESNRASIAVEIRATPVATIASISPVCEESTINLTSDGAGPSGTYAWTGPASFTANTAAPTRANAIEDFEGTYVVTVTNGVSCSATASVTVVINPLPPTPVAGDKVFCPGDAEAILAAEGTPGNTLIWYNNSIGGSPSGTAPKAYPTTEGITFHYVSQKDANGCESHRDTLMVKVNAKPATPVAEDKTYCQGVPAVALTATVAADHKLLWYDTSSGGTGTGVAPVPSTDDVVTLTFYVSQKDNTTGCESDRDNAIVTVNLTPNPPTVAPITYCEQEKAEKLIATGVPGNTVQWFVDGGTTLTAPTPNTSLAGLTMFYVSQTIPGTGCESGMAQIPVTVNPKPVATVIAVNSLCVGTVSQNNAQLILTRYRNTDEVSYNIGSTYGTPTPTAYATVPSGGVFASSLPNPTIASQDYTVRIKNSFNCTTDVTKPLTQTNCACPGGYCEPATVTKTK